MNLFPQKEYHLLLWIFHVYNLLAVIDIFQLYFLLSLICNKLSLMCLYLSGEGIILHTCIGLLLIIIQLMIWLCNEDLLPGIELWITFFFFLNLYCLGNLLLIFLGLIEGWLWYIYFNFINALVFDYKFESDFIYLSQRN